MAVLDIENVFVFWGFLGGACGGARRLSLNRCAALQGADLQAVHFKVWVCGWDGRRCQQRGGAAGYEAAARVI